MENEKIERTTTYEHEIISLCARCGGTGEVKLGEIYVAPKDRKGYEPCTRCNGTGRVYLSKETTIFVRPFKEKE